MILRGFFYIIILPSIMHKSAHVLKFSLLHHPHKDTFGYRCLTDQKQVYQENYPGIVIEKGNIDELITIMIQGEKI